MQSDTQQLSGAGPDSIHWLLHLKERIERLSVGLAPPTQSFDHPPTDDERHHIQRQAFVEQLRAASLLDASEPLHTIEFGCGNGALSYAVWLASRGACSSVLIDRRQVLPQTLVHAQAEVGLPAASHLGTGAPAWQPLHTCADVSQIDAEFLRTTVCGGRCVALANHLCGDALDCAMRAAVEAWPGEGDSGHLEAFLAATCCHHKIQWEAFAGRELFATWGLSPQDFEQIRRWSRFAPRRSREASTQSRVTLEAERLCISADEAAALGTSCRLLLDRARKSFLSNHGFATTLLHHVPFEATGDNVLMVAVRPRMGA